ncbi:hypothetical protein H072_674 [Dactylellina haptotyla CBS 200.50]|uniref:Peptide hydrolase n=1 Tax=Dactylellina haptotyla (strain CBS 200.50) TaxID=1284197 RepID=S8AR12_DACHA|nr:hypothetical protein H072_674 [Dactylellina haptotyla CBS 200.50]
MPPTDPDPCHPNPLFPSAAQFIEQTHNITASLADSALQDDLKALTSFHTRHYRTSSGRDAALWIQKRLKSVPSGATNTTVELFQHGWKQPSVIARIPGVSNTTVILGAHIDSVNMYLPFFLAAPGANDDASGVVALLSVFDALSRSLLSPTNTIELQFYAAEEAGFWGSAEVLSSYNNAHRDVHSVLQFDMIGRMASKEKPAVGIVIDYLPASFNKYLKLLVSTYLDIPAVDTACGYACSDHASAIRYGYAGGLVTAGRLEASAAEDVSHTGSDTMERIYIDHVMEFTKLGVAYAYELGFADLGATAGGGSTGMRGYTCDLGYPDGWLGDVRRFAAARATDPLGFALWFLAVVILLALARPWEEVPWLMRMGRRVKRVFRRRSRSLYTKVAARDD